MLKQRKQAAILGENAETPSSGQDLCKEYLHMFLENENFGEKNLNIWHFRTAEQILAALNQLMKSFLFCLASAFCIIKVWTFEILWNSSSKTINRSSSLNCDFLQIIKRV